MDLKLYVIPGSHPCVAVEAALNLKGLAYERVDLLPGASIPIQLARFGRRTVPGRSLPHPVGPFRPPPGPRPRRGRLPRPRLAADHADARRPPARAAPL